jgi:hypothetical protein
MVEAPPADRSTVVIADDDRSFALHLRDWFAERGYEAEILEVLREEDVARHRRVQRGEQARADDRDHREGAAGREAGMARGSPVGGSPGH